MIYTYVYKISNDQFEIDVKWMHRLKQNSRFIHRVKTRNNKKVYNLFPPKNEYRYIWCENCESNPISFDSIN